MSYTPFSKFGYTRITPAETIYSTANSIFSLRKLNPYYTGNCIRVRRSNDNAETDIGFVGKNLDTATITSFVGVNSAFVTTWYDQSVLANNVIQATAVNQPRIVDAGTIETMGGKPTLRFDGTDVMASGSSLITGNSSYTFTVVYSSPQSATVVPFFTGLPINGQGTGVGYNVTSNRYNSFIWASAESLSNPLDANTPIIQTARREAGVSLVNFVNGVSGSVVSTPTANFTSGFYIGAANNLIFLTGAISEVIANTSALSTTNRQIVEADQGAYYGITVV